MIYQAYQGRLRRLSGAFAVLWRFRILFIAALVLLIAFLVVLFTVPGTVYAESCPQTIVYGQALPFEAKVVWGDLSVEYCGEDGAWTQAAPRRTGEYRVRAVSRSLTGKAKYGKIFHYTILPLAAEVAYEGDAYRYGDEATFSAELAYEDVLAEVEFSFELLSEDRCTVQADSLAVIGDGGEDMTDCYTLTLSPREAAFVRRPLSVTAKGGEKVYDGTPLSVQEYEITEGSVAEGQRLQVDFSASVTDVGSAANDPVFSVTNENGEDVTRYYDVQWQIGTLTVTPRPLTFYTHNAERVYDGTPLTAHTYAITEGSVAEGQRLQIDFSASVTDVGSLPNAAEYAIFDAAGRDVTQNYSLSVQIGTLTVIPRPLAFFTHGAERVYDGTPLSVRAYEVTEGSPAAGQHLDVELSASITEAGTVSNTPEYAVFDAEGRDVSRNYAFSVEEGSLTVIPRPLTVATESGQKVYDGTSLSAHEYTVTAGSVAEGQRLEVDFLVTLLDAMTVENDVLVTVFGADGRDVTHNYALTLERGTVSVLPRPLTVATGSGQKVYDGTPLSVHEYTVTEGSVAEGQSLDVAFLITLLDVMTVENNVLVTVFGADGRDVTYNYALTLEKGTVSVQPRPLTVETESKQKVYDGTSLSGGGVRVSEPLPAGHTLEVTAEAWQTDVGSRENRPEFVILDDTQRDVLHNFDLIWRAGSLTVTPRPLTVETASAVWIYDGERHSAPEFQIVEGTLAPWQAVGIGYEFTLTEITDTETEVRYRENACSVAIVDAWGRDVTDNYAVTYRYGKLRIKTPIVLDVDMISKVYDGTPLSFTEEDYSLVKPPDVRVELTLPSLTERGALYYDVISLENENCLLRIDAYDPVSGENVNGENRFIVLTEDKLWPLIEVRQRELEISTISITTKNNGQTLYGQDAEKSWWISQGSLADGHTIAVEVTGELSPQAERAENTVGSVRIYDADGNDVTHNYEIAFKHGTLAWEQ